MRNNVTGHLQKCCSAWVLGGAVDCEPKGGLTASGLLHPESTHGGKSKVLIPGVQKPRERAKELLVSSLSSFIMVG